VASTEPNPPIWDTDRVKILDPLNSTASQSIVDAIYAENGADNLEG